MLGDNNNKFVHLNELKNMKTMLAMLFAWESQRIMYLEPPRFICESRLMVNGQKLPLEWWHFTNVAIQGFNAQNSRIAKMFNGVKYANSTVMITLKISMNYTI